MVSKKVVFLVFISLTIIVSASFDIDDPLNLSGGANELDASLQKAIKQLDASLKESVDQFNDRFESGLANNIERFHEGNLENLLLLSETGKKLGEDINTASNGIIEGLESFSEIINLKTLPKWYSIVIAIVVVIFFLLLLFHYHKKAMMLNISMIELLSDKVNFKNLLIYLISAALLISFVTFLVYRPQKKALKDYKESYSKKYKNYDFRGMIEESKKIQKLENTTLNRDRLAKDAILYKFFSNPFAGSNPKVIAELFTDFNSELENNNSHKMELLVLGSYFELMNKNNKLIQFIAANACLSILSSNPERYPPYYYLANDIILNYLANPLPEEIEKSIKPEFLYKIQDQFNTTTFTKFKFPFYTKDLIKIKISEFDFDYSNGLQPKNIESILLFNERYRSIHRQSNENYLKYIKTENIVRKKNLLAKLDSVWRAEKAFYKGNLKIRGLSQDFRLYDWNDSYHTRIVHLNEIHENVLFKTEKLEELYDVYDLKEEGRKYLKHKNEIYYEGQRSYDQCKDKPIGASDCNYGPKGQEWCYSCLQEIITVKKIRPEINEMPSFEKYNSLISPYKREVVENIISSYFIKSNNVKSFLYERAKNSTINGYNLLVEFETLYPNVQSLDEKSFQRLTDIIMFLGLTNENNSILDNFEGKASDKLSNRFKHLKQSPYELYNFCQSKTNFL